MKNARSRGACVLGKQQKSHRFHSILYVVCFSLSLLILPFHPFAYWNDFAFFHIFRNIVSAILFTVDAKDLYISSDSKKFQSFDCSLYFFLLNLLSLSVSFSLFLGEWERMSAYAQATNIIPDHLWEVRCAEYELFIANTL